MRHVLVLVLAAAVVLSCSCGNVKVSGALNTSTFSGNVSIVRLTLTSDGSQVTLVTLASGMASQDFTFCGNVVSSFPMNASVVGSFTPGSTCGTIVQVSIRS